MSLCNRPHGVPMFLVAYRYLLCLVIALWSVIHASSAQSRAYEPEITCEVRIIPPWPQHNIPPYDSTAPRRWVETMPAFKGDLMAYLAATRRYPDSSLARGEEGRVVVQFVIDTTGRVREPRIVRSSTFPLLDLEALRVIRTMIPEALWTPGKQDGRKKEVIFTLPVTFKIE